MNDRRLISLAALVFVMFGFAGCKSGQFASDFAPEIEKDCYESVVCATKTVDTAKISVCVNKSGTDLSAAPVTVQQEFIDTVSRCQELLGCPYFNCASLSSTGYSVAHAQQIAKDCQETIQCRVSTNQPQGPTAVADCISVQSNKLDSNLASQAEFDAKFARCATTKGCDWIACK